MTIPDDDERGEFYAMWTELWLPGEFHTMDAFNQKRWRGVIEEAWKAGRAALRVELKDSSPEGGR